LFRRPKCIGHGEDKFQVFDLNCNGGLLEHQPFSIPILFILSKKPTSDLRLLSADPPGSGIERHFAPAKRCRPFGIMPLACFIAPHPRGLILGSADLGLLGQCLA
jgi:hypothetical protein